MIVRSRPDIDEDLLLSIIEGQKICVNNISEPLNSFFFNSGSSSLLFFLSMFGLNKKVGIQVYTCSTILDTIKKAGDIPVFMDINKDYFSTTYDIVSSVIDSIDILILTHLFGIPNPDYLEIKKLCKTHNIILLDDLCQTYHAMVGQRFLEDLSDNYFYSFFYDKPISGASGGLLKVSSLLYDSALSRYIKLEKESNAHGVMLLRKLYWMNKLLSPNNYTRDFRVGSLWEDLLMSYYPIKWPVDFIYKCLFIGRIFLKLGLSYKKKSKVMAMSDIHKYYILNRMFAFRNNNDVLEGLYKSIDSPFPSYLLDSRIKCSLAKRCIVQKSSGLTFTNTEIALYNWPHLITSCNGEHYPVSSFVIENYVNLPLWYKDILLFAKEFI